MEVIWRLFGGYLEVDLGVVWRLFGGQILESLCDCCGYLASALGSLEQQMFQF